MRDIYNAITTFCILLSVILAACRASPAFTTWANYSPTNSPHLPYLTQFSIDLSDVSDILSLPPLAFYEQLTSIIYEFGDTYLQPLQVANESYALTLYATDPAFLQWALLIASSSPVTSQVESESLENGAILDTVQLSDSFNASTCLDSFETSNQTYFFFQTESEPCSVFFNQYFQNAFNYSRGPCETDSDCQSISAQCHSNMWGFALLNATTEAFSNVLIPPKQCVEQSDLITPLLTARYDILLESTVSLSTQDAFDDLTSAILSFFDNLVNTTRCDEEVDHSTLYFAIDVLDTASFRNASIYLINGTWACLQSFVPFSESSTDNDNDELFVITQWAGSPSCIFNASVEASVFLDTETNFQTINMCYAAASSTPSQCGSPCLGFAPCKTQSMCSDAMQCGTVDIFEGTAQTNSLFCLINQTTDIVEYTITLIPTVPLALQSNSSLLTTEGQEVSFADRVSYLQFIARLLIIYQVSSCWRADSAYSVFIPNDSPYLTASVFATRAMTSLPFCQSTPLFSSLEALWALLYPVTPSTKSTFDTSIFDVSLSLSITASNVPSAQCSRDNAIIFGETCLFTPEESTGITLGCIVDAQCQLGQSCRVIGRNNFLITACVSVDQVPINLVKFTLSIPDTGLMLNNIQAISTASKVLVSVLTDLQCFNLDTLSAAHIVSSNPATSMALYMTDFAAVDECLVAMDQYDQYAAQLSISSEVINQSFNTTACTNSSSKSFTCDDLTQCVPDSCLKGAFSACSNSSSCDPGMYCEFVTMLASTYCINSASNHLVAPLILLMLLTLCLSSLI